MKAYEILLEENGAIDTLESIYGKTRTFNKRNDIELLTRLGFDIYGKFSKFFSPSRALFTCEHDTYVCLENTDKQFIVPLDKLNILDMYTFRVQLTSSLKLFVKTKVTFNKIKKEIFNGQSESE
jgi:hypothetical protein